jgi:acetolactate synthase regulatory subunit
MEFDVIWRIQVEAETPDEAARIALSIVRDRGSDATFFNVTNIETGETEEIDAALLSDDEYEALDSQMSEVY